MLSQLLENKKKKLKTKTPSKKSKGKWKEGEGSSYAHTKEEEHSNSESFKPPSEEGGNSENGSTHSKRISKLKQRLEVLASQKGLQEAGVVRPYLAEWDLVNPTGLRWQGVTEPAHIVLQVLDRKCSIK